MEGETKYQAIPRRQRGSIAMFAALGLGVTVIMLSILDMGFLYNAKRSYQNAADLAALAGASRMYEGCAAAEAAASAHARHQLGAARDGDLIEAECGIWRPSNNPPFVTVGSDESEANAVRMRVSGVPRRFFVPGDRRVFASAIAMADAPVAALSARSSLLTVNTEQSPLLNSVVGGLLGGSVNLPVAAWNGLLDTDINLLNYIEALALRLGVNVGDQSALLGSTVTVGELLDVAIDVLPAGSTANVALNGLLSASLPGLGDSFRLGDLLALTPGTNTGGLDAGLNLFEFVQATAQLAGRDRIVNVSLPGLNVQLKVIEPPQISAVGNPSWATDNPYGAGQIYVRTAQVRLLASVELPALLGVTGLVNAVLNLASPVTTLLNNVLSLNLVGALTGLVGSLVGIPYEVTDIQVVPGNPRIDVSLDAGGGDARVVDYDCSDPNQTRLTAEVSSAAGQLRIGRLNLDPASPQYVFASAAPPSVAPVPLIDVGVKTCRVFLAVISTCEARRPFEGGGLGIEASTSIFSTQVDHPFIQPPLMGEEPAYASFPTQNLVNGLSGTLTGVQLRMYGPASGGGLGGVLNLVGAAFNTVRNILEPLIAGLLSPLLDPLLNLLTDTLGINLNDLEVGANLSCDAGGGILVQ
jgi:uncharacterized membrane protein